MDLFWGTVKMLYSYTNCKTTFPYRRISVAADYASHKFQNLKYLLLKLNNTYPLILAPIILAALGKKDEATFDRKHNVEFIAICGFSNGRNL